MAQYQLYEEGEYMYWTNPVTSRRTIRFGQRGGLFVVDIALTANEFTGTQNVDWENIRASAGGLSGTFREGVRSTNFVLDVGGDFSGTVGVDWENLNTA